MLNEVYVMFLQKLRVHVVTPPISQKLPAPKYKEAIQAVAAANTVQEREMKQAYPKALTHHGTQTIPINISNFTQTHVSQ